MLYLLDDDKFDAVIKTYKCEFIFDEIYKNKLRYFKSEDDIDFQPESLTSKDVICFHNSFPSNKTAIIERIKFFNEENKAFQIICFSLDGSFYQTKQDESELRIHKDRFYFNLKPFIDSGFQLKKIIFGEYSSKSEAKLITTRILEMLFSLADKEPFDIKTALPGDLKRLCELADYDYESFIEKVEDVNVGKFRKVIVHLNKSI